MTSQKRIIDSAAADFADRLRAIYVAPIAGQPEDQLKQPVRDLLVASGRAFGLEVDSRTEVAVPSVGGRPDLGVMVNGLLSGHVELKAPGKERGLSASSTPIDSSGSASRLSPT